MDDAATVLLPSGQSVVVQDVIADRTDALSMYRFRFVAPHISGDMSEAQMDEVTKDMTFICDGHIRNYLTDVDDDPDQIVISFADREVEFGVATPDAVQFFQAFSIKGDACVWELF